MIVILDGLDKIVYESGKELLYWLPTTLPPNLKIIASLYTASSTHTVLRDNHYFTEIEMKELTLHEVALISQNIALSYELQVSTAVHNEIAYSILASVTDSKDLNYLNSMYQFIKMHVDNDIEFEGNIKESLNADVRGIFIILFIYIILYEYLYVYIYTYI
jgi:hypothetical protein